MGMTCTVCRHPNREEIDRLISSTVPERNIAARYGLSPGAVHRHRRKHITGSLTDTDRAKAVTALEHSIWLVSKLRAMAEGMESVPRQFAHVADVLNRSVAVLARITGEIQSPTVQQFVVSVGARDEAEIRSALSLIRGAGYLTLEAARDDAVALIELAMTQDPEWAREVRLRLASIEQRQLTNGDSQAEEVA